MAVFIKGVGNISPQKTLNGEFLEDLIAHTSNYFSCVEPDYKSYINPTLIRRMGRIIKMGVASASVCLKDAGVQMPDAIITGTGLGCIVDTDKFLSSIIENEEQFLTPTSFIQSTHNTISAQIALLIKCMNYNFTYVHRGFSFESALQDSMMLLDEGEANNVLVGGVDEITPNYFTITTRLGHWKNTVQGHLTFVASQTRGAFAGEGAAYFVLSKERSNHNYAQIQSIESIYKPNDIGDIETRINNFLYSNSLNIEDIDLVILGTNGDYKGDSIYHQLGENIFKNSNTAHFKHLSGEYPTASSFALWLGAKILKSQHVPEVTRLKYKEKKEIKHVLIYNHYMEINHSLYLISQC